MLQRGYKVRRTGRLRGPSVSTCTGLIETTLSPWGFCDVCFLTHRWSAADVLSVLLSAVWREFRSVCVCSVNPKRRALESWRRKIKDTRFTPVLIFKIPARPIARLMGFLISLRSCQKRLKLSSTTCKQGFVEWKPPAKYNTMWNKTAAFPQTRQFGPFSSRFAAFQMKLAIICTDYRRNCV